MNFELYDRIRKTGLVWAVLLDHFKSLEVKAADTVVIGGCGVGYSFKHWEKRFPNAEVFGVDPIGDVARYKKWCNVKTCGRTVLVIEWPNPEDIEYNPWDAEAVEALMCDDLVAVIEIGGQAAPLSDAFNVAVKDFQKKTVVNGRMFDDSVCWINLYRRADTHESKTQ